MGARQHSLLKFSTNEESWFCWSLWIAICILALGFPNKYKERLAYFEDLIPRSDSSGICVIPWSQNKTFSDRGGTSGRKTMRQKQQEEWDRLNIAVSVITATSAAALAIQATDLTQTAFIGS